MAAATRLIVGLGNPGPEYADTRHNIGYRVADEVARRARFELDEHYASSTAGEGRWRSRRLAVAKPLTYMNRSGEAVRALIRRFKATPKDLLVVVDDIHLPLGTIRIRQGGGTGGHNGLEDITYRLGTADFPRMRVGVGNDFARGGQSDFVLSPFDADEVELSEAAIERAAKAALCFVTDGLQTAMNRHNVRING